MRDRQTIQKIVDRVNFRSAVHYSQWKSHLFGKLLELSKNDVMCYTSDWYHDAMILRNLPDKVTKAIRLSYGWRDSGTSLYVVSGELERLFVDNIAEYHQIIGDKHIIHITVSPAKYNEHVDLSFELIGD